MNELQEFEYVKALYKIDDLHPVFGTVLDTFENLSGATVQGHIYLWEVLQQIKVNLLTNIDVETFLTPKYLNGTKNRLYDKLKVLQSAVCYNATFKGYKDLSHLKSITNLMFLDIDDFKSIEEAIEYKKDIITKYDWIVACSLSLSRQGLHIIALVDKIHDNDDFNKKYDFISEKYFNKRLDKSAKSLTRFTIIPHDANIFINMNPNILGIDDLYTNEKGLRSVELSSTSEKKSISSVELSSITSDTKSISSVDLFDSIDKKGISTMDLCNHSKEKGIRSVELCTNNQSNGLFSAELSSIVDNSIKDLKKSIFSVYKEDIICSAYTFSENHDLDCIFASTNEKRIRFSQEVNESLFDNPNTPIFIPDGIDVVKINSKSFENKKFEIGERTSFIGAIGAQLIAINAKHNQTNNNLRNRILGVLKRLNKKHCSPPLEHKEVENSFSANWKRYVNGELDVSRYYIKQYVFWSNYSTLTGDKKRSITKILKDSETVELTKKKILDAINELYQKKEKITQPKVAKSSGLALPTVKKYGKYYKEKVKEIKQTNSQTSHDIQCSPLIETNTKEQVEEVNSITVREDISAIALSDYNTTKPDNNSGINDGEINTHSKQYKISNTQQQQPEKDRSTISDDDADNQGIDFGIIEFSDEDIIKPDPNHESEIKIGSRQVFQSLCANIIANLNEDEIDLRYHKFNKVFNELSDEDKKLLSISYKETVGNDFWKKTSLESRLSGQVFPIDEQVG